MVVLLQNRPFACHCTWLLITLLSLISFARTVESQPQKDEYPALEDVLPPQVTCPTCTPSFDLKSGFKFDWNCTIGQTTYCIKFPLDNVSSCISPMLFGGKYYQLEVPSQSYFIGTFSSIPFPGEPKGSIFLQVEQTLELYATHPVPLNLTAPYKFSNCTAIINNQTCNDCSICTDDPGKIKYDCSNIVVATFPNGTDVTFPKHTNCMGLPLTDVQEAEYVHENVIGNNNNDLNGCQSLIDRVPFMDDLTCGCEKYLHSIEMY